MSSSRREPVVAAPGPPIRRRFLRLTWINILSNVTVPLAGLVLALFMVVRVATLAWAARDLPERIARAPGAD